MFLYHLRPALLAIVLCLAAPPAYATKDVSSPTVTKGKLKFDARYGFETDDTQERDNRFRQLYLFEYGVTDWWLTRLNFRVNHPDGGEFDYTNIDFENKFQFFYEKKDGFNGAVKFIYSVADDVGIPNIFEIKGIVEKDFGHFWLRGNLGVQWQIGADQTKAATLNAALQTTRKIGDDLSVGMEWIGDFGQFDNSIAANVQEHYLGPVLNYKINNTWSIETGYLFGISETASNGLFKFFVKGIF